jgi:hypothetical protein
VRAHPRGPRDAVGPLLDGVLHVRVTRPATDGQANAAVRRLVADALGLAPSRVRLVAGERARMKRYEVEGLDPAELRTRLAGIGGEAD